MFFQLMSFLRVELASCKDNCNSCTLVFVEKIDLRWVEKNEIIKTSHVQNFMGFVKVAYYSFRKRKITFLELKFKPNWSFVLGHLLVKLLKEMTLTLIILKKM